MRWRQQPELLDGVLLSVSSQESDAVTFAQKAVDDLNYRDDAPCHVVAAVQDAAPRRPSSSVVRGLFEGVDDRWHHPFDAVTALGR